MRHVRVWREVGVGSVVFVAAGLTRQAALVRTRGRAASVRPAKDGHNNSWVAWVRRDGREALCS
jgi:hypothetical protein